MKVNPPKKALRFLRWFCREDCIDEIEGDLWELYEKQFQKSPSKARRKFIWGVLKYFRPEFIKSFKFVNPLTSTIMIRHNLLITYRSFLRYKSSFFINLLGLSTGLAAVILIYLWVHDEVSFDKFHKNDQRLYQVLRNVSLSSGGIETVESHSTLLPIALVSEMPEVEYAVPVRPTSQGIVSADSLSVKATAWFVGKNFFKAFSFDMILGNKDQILREKYSVAISDDLAVSLFGSGEESIGKVIKGDPNQYGGDYVVSGVFRKPGNNSSARFDLLLPYENFLENNRMDVSWFSAPILTYLTLKTEAKVDTFNEKLTRFYRSKRGEEVNKQDSMFLQHFSDRYLYGHFDDGKQAGGRIEYVVLFSLVALLILVIACINFMNLSTARASRRLKEIGIKKTVGASKTVLIVQHIGESMLMVMLSTIVALILVYWLLPQFNQITGKELVLLPNWSLSSRILSIAVVTGLVSGSYPAFYLSAFKPVDVLKGKINTSWGELWVRKGLVVFQFSVSIVFIVAVAVVYKQLNFVQSKNLGYERENVISLEKQGQLNDHLETFLSETRDIPGVVYTSSLSEHITGVNSTSSGHSWEGQVAGGTDIEFTGANINHDFLETLGIKLKEGRSFSRDLSNNDAAVILNEAAIDAMNLENPVGKWIELFGMKREIIGVSQNFHFQSLYEKIKPMFLIYNPKYTHTILLRVQPTSRDAAISELKKLYHRYNPDVPFEITFLDNEYQSLYVSEQRSASLSKYFASIAIVVSSLGLLGLVTFSVERRTKEIGIRKILGCSELMIVSLLSKDFTKMVLAATAIALPTSYFIAKHWLDTFAYRIELQWWYFVAGGVMALFITWLTVSISTLRAAQLNPTECLRNE